MPRNESSRPAGKRPLRALTPQEKIDAINRVHNGESKAAVARDIGVPESTLRGWCKAEEKIRTQLNNMRASGNYEHILTTSSSENSDNSRPGSSSRSTPTAQTTVMGIGSTSGAVEKASEELEAGPAQKRIKLDNLTSSTSTFNMNNISTSARTPTIGNETLMNPYNMSLYNMFVNDPNKSLNLFNTLIKAGELFPFSGYSSPATNLLTDGLLQRNNGTMTANMMTIANMMKQQQTNNALLNGNKRKYNTSGLGTSTADIPRTQNSQSRRQNSQSPNVEKSSGSISQPVNNRTSPLPSTSTNNDVVASISTKSKNCKTLHTIISNLQQQHVPSARVCNMGEEMISNNAINNNNNNVDHVDNENTNRRSPNSLPPGFAEILSCCTKLVEWLQNYGSPICTFQQVTQVRSILDSMTNWANSKEIEPKKKTNSTS